MVLPGTASASAPYEYLSVQPTEMVFMQFTVTDTNVVGVLHANSLSSSPTGQTLFLPVSCSIASNDYDFNGTETSGYIGRIPYFQPPAPPEHQPDSKWKCRKRTRPDGAEPTGAPTPPDRAH